MLRESIREVLVEEDLVETVPEFMVDANCGFEHAIENDVEDANFAEETSATIFEEDEHNNDEVEDVIFAEELNAIMNNVVDQSFAEDVVSDHGRDDNVRLACAKCRILAKFCV